ncbi:hypothetical protein ACS0TY_035806 [Phlomoides rotata]
MRKHALRDCALVRHFWQVAGVLDDSAMESTRPIGEWIYDTVMGLESSAAELFLYLLWQLWFARNKLYFDLSTLAPQFMKTTAISFRDEYKRAQARVFFGQQLVLRGSSRWVRPALGTLKLNTDAAVRREQGVAVGGVARDCRGDVRWCFASRVDLEAEVDLAEAMAAYMGLVEARNKFEDRVVLETDSQWLYYALTKPRPDYSRFGEICDEILALRECFLVLLLIGVVELVIVWLIV